VSVLLGTEADMDVINTKLPTILHVDDDDNDHIFFNLAHQQTKIPANIVEVSDGEQAIDYLDRKGDYADGERAPMPSLVLLDLKLPRQSGFEVLEWIRGNSRFDRMPVIILSSSDDPSDKHRAFMTGADCYLVKPVSVSRLVETVKYLHRIWLPRGRAKPHLAAA